MIRFSGKAPETPEVHAIEGMEVHYVVWLIS
jgi:hypothetical protein